MMEIEKRTIPNHEEQTDIMEALSSAHSDWDDHLDHLTDAGMKLVMQLVPSRGLTDSVLAS